MGDAPAAPAAAAANLAATMADIAEKITEGVEVLGGIEDVVEKKETTPANTESAVKEPSPGPTLEPIGAVEDLKAEVNAVLSSSDKENVELIDIAVIEEPEDSANDVESKIESVLN